MCGARPGQVALAQREAELAALQQRLAGGAGATQGLEARLRDQAALLAETTRVRAMLTTLPLLLLLQTHPRVSFPPQLGSRTGLLLVGS